MNPGHRVKYGWTIFWNIFLSKKWSKKMVPKIVQSIFHPTPVRSASGYISLVANVVPCEVRAESKHLV